MAIGKHGPAARGSGAHPAKRSAPRDANGTMGTRLVPEAFCRAVCDSRLQKRRPGGVERGGGGSCRRSASVGSKVNREEDIVYRAARLREILALRSAVLRGNGQALHFDGDGLEKTLHFG